MSDDLWTRIGAQLDEDERVAREAGRAGLDWPDMPGERLGPELAHARRHDPARALRQVEAGRRILARHRVDESDHAWRYSAPRYCVGCGYQGDCDDPVTEDIDRCPELLDLAYGLGIEA